MTSVRTTAGRESEMGIGAALRAERERRRISLDAVGRGTLVRMDFLELIDQDRLEELPSGAYAKGFIRSYAAYLGLDPKPFLEAYERRCGRPAPELSRVVRRGVRVPPAAQPRARRIAVISALGVIALLAILGAFRSGDDPVDVMQTAPAFDRVRGASAPNAVGAVLRIDVISDETWVEAMVDDQPAFAQTLAPGESRTFRGERSVTLFLARAPTTEITVNGRMLGSPDTDSYRGTFTSRTTELPPNELEAAEEPAAAAEPEGRESQPEDSPEG